MPAPSPSTDQPVVLDPEQRERLQSLLAHRLRQLVEPFENIEPWFRWDAVVSRWENTPRGFHVVDMPSLLDQVRTSTKQAHGSAAGGYESRPTAHLDAIDMLAAVDAGASEFVGAVLHVQPRSVDENVRRIIERIGTLTDPELVDQRDADGKPVNRLNLERLVRSWWISARILSGLDSRPWTPHNRCPQCGAMDSLRIRPDVAGKVGIGWCKECKETWDETQIWMLGAQIREQNHDDSEETGE